MSKINPQIFNGTDRVILSESFLADDFEPIMISVPTTDNRNAMLFFNILRGEPLQPSYQASSEENKTKVTFTLGSQFGAHIGTKHKVRVEISGTDYYLLFGITRFVGSTVRVEVTLFEIGVLNG